MCVPDLIRFRRVISAAVAAGLLSLLAASAVLANPPLDLGLFRQGPSRVILDYDGNAVPDYRIRFATPPSHVLAADMNGDGLADIVSYRDGVWSVDYDLDGVPDETWYFGGVPGDVPLLGDIDGDGRPDLVIYRNGKWFVSFHRDGVADRIFAFGGAPGDIPLLADLNCDGVSELIIYNAGIWSVDSNFDGNVDVAAGLGGAPEDRPFAADWDGDCKDDIGVFRDGIWYVLRDPFGAMTMSTAAYGTAGDMPLAARLDRAVTGAKYRSRSTRFGLWRPTDETFLLRLSREIYPDLYLFRGISGTAFAAPLGSGSNDALVIYAAGAWHVDRDLDGVTDDCLRISEARRRTFRSPAMSTAMAARISSSTAMESGTSAPGATASRTSFAASAAPPATSRFWPT